MAHTTRRRACSRPATRRLTTTTRLLGDAWRFLWLLVQPKLALAARCLTLEKQLALYVERKAKPQRFDDASRITLALLSRVADLRHVFVAVKPSSLVRWHRSFWALYWGRISRPLGRPQVPEEAQRLIAQMSRDNPTWGQGRIQKELLLKLGVQYSSRTIRRYMVKASGRGPGRTVSRERWMTFIRSHAQSLLACDFFMTLTLGFTRLYVFVVMEVGSRKILHWGVTRHPTAEWTIQQLREAVPADHSYRFLVHDRDRIFSAELDRVIGNMGLRVLKTPPQAPQANAFCERLIGTIRRECLDFFLPWSESALRAILREWVAHYNRARPHSRLGPGFPEATPGLPVQRQPHRHRLPDGYRVTATPVLGGLHNEYGLEKIAA